MNVFVEVQGIDPLLRVLVEITSEEIQSIVTRKTAMFLRNKMQRYPIQRYVGRAEAYGKTFQSDKQRRWFFAALRSGELQIPYGRTNQLSAGWQLVNYGGADWALENSVPYVGYVQGEPQSRMMQMRGWRTINQVMDEDASQIETFAQETYNTEFKRYVGRLS